MSSYCFKCRKNTESINPRVFKNFKKSFNGKIMIISKCTICGNKESRFTKKQKASGILSNLSLTTPSNKIP